MSLLDKIAAENTQVTTEKPPRLLDRIAAENRSGIGLPQDPDEQNKILKSVLDNAQATGLPLDAVERNNQNLNEELSHVDATWKQAQNDTLSVWKPGILERIKNYFYTPTPPGGFDRSDRPLRTAGELGLVAGAETVSGLLLRAPDIAVAKLTGEPTAAAALAEVLGLERTPSEETQGALLRTLGQLKTLGMATGPLITTIPARESLRIILHSGITLGAAETVDQITEKITEGKPFNIEGIHFSAGLGVLFGAGAVGVQKFTRFIKGVRSTKDLAVTGKITFDKGKFPSSRAEARAEINAALKVRESDPAEWQRVVDKYVRAVKPSAARPVTPTAIKPETADIVKRYPGAIQRAAANTDARAVNSLMAMGQTEVQALEKAVDSDISSAVSELKAQAPAEVPAKAPTEPAKAPTAAEPTVTPEGRQVAEVGKIEPIEAETALPPKRQVAQPTPPRRAGPAEVEGKIEDRQRVREMTRANMEVLDDNVKKCPRCTNETLEAFGIRETEPVIGGLGVRKAFNDNGFDLRLVQDEDVFAEQPRLKKFIEEHPEGSFYIMTDQHAMALIDGKLTDFAGGTGRRKVVGAFEILPKPTPTQPAKAGLPAPAEVTKPKEPVKIEPTSKLFGKGGAETGIVNVEPIQKLHETFVDIVEPAKTAERAVGKEAVATVMRGVHNPDVAEIEFTEAELTGHDKTIGEMRKWFSQFKDKDLRNLMISRGTPISDEAQLIQQQAIRDLPEEFEGMKAANAIQQIADFNYAKLQEVVGEDINKVKDYFYGIYEDPEAVDNFIDTWKTTKRFTKEKKLPTVADAIAYGLELRHANPVDNLKAEYMGIARLEGMTWMRDELIRTGKGLFIEELADAPLEMKGVVRDPVFRGFRLHPDLAKLINNLIEKNWVTTGPGRIAGTLNVLRQINNFSRTVKFAGSGFHLALIAEQALADAGYLGFLYKKTALRGLTLGFKESDPIFKTEAYKDYIANGGGHRFSIESESERMVNQAISEFNETASKAVKIGMMPLKVPTGFVKWMFQSYIPKVKYGKYLDRVNEETQKLGRNLKRSEKQDIIKENQNFYGMMNERLFGRSGTVTTMLRFPFMSPGFAEGNYRTMLKAFFQWGQTQEAEVLKGLPGAKEKGFDASRSRSNIFNSLILGGIAATTGTLILTGKPPKKPETLDDMRDLMKIDTGQVDEKGRKIMIDTLTYGRDYWDVMFNLFMLRPDKAAEAAFKRVGGMTAPTAKMILDMAMMVSGRAIYDYKGDRVVEVTDSFLQKTLKLVAHEVKELSPISVSVFTQARKRDLDTVTAAIGTLVGLRPTKTEEERRNQKIINNLYSLRGQQEKLHLHLGRISNPRKAIKIYNKTVQDVLDYKFVTDAMREEWGPKLLIDEEKLLQNKAFQLATASATDQEISRAKQFLKNFDITVGQIPKLLKDRKARLRAKPKKRPHPLETQPIIGDLLKEKRAKERFKE